jgi:hypothetical protein
MSDSDKRPSPPDVGLPAGVDVKRAFDLYVFGRNRNLDPREKVSAMDGDPSTKPDPPPAPKPVEPLPSTSVAVPERGDLRYHRSAGTWRDRTSADGRG